MTGAIEKWEEIKKYQRQVDKLRTKLSDTEAELKKTKANNDTLKTALERYNQLA